MSEADKVGNVERLVTHWQIPGQLPTELGAQPLQKPVVNGPAMAQHIFGIYPLRAEILLAAGLKSHETMRH